MKAKRLAFTVISGALMLAVMITIFCFSNQKGETSSAVSNSVGSYIVEEVFHKEVPPGVRPDTIPLIFTFTIRNLAHIFLFGCLGLTSYLFSLSGLWLIELRGRGIKQKPFVAAAVACGISLLYAGFDELHQYFVGGRSATFRDVGIDAIGFVLAIAVGLAVTLIVETVLHSRQKSKNCGKS